MVAQYPDPWLVGMGTGQRCHKMPTLLPAFQRHSLPSGQCSDDHELVDDHDNDDDADHADHDYNDDYGDDDYEEEDCHKFPLSLPTTEWQAHPTPVCP